MNSRIVKMAAMALVLAAAPAAMRLASRAAAKPAGAGTAADDAAIKAVVANMSAGWNAHDAHAMCAGLAEDVEWVSWSGGVTHGNKNVESQHAAQFATTYKATHRVDNVKTIHYLTPELASVDDYWSMTGAKMRDGSDWPYREGLVNSLMAKRDGRWQVIVSHTADFNAKAPSSGK